jgi:pyridoxine kinase
MSYNKILTIQDISCVGQCSLTVALPILSACGQETCILPSAVLSTHTGGFKGFTFRDLTDDLPLIQQHWQKENIKFDAIYTGYLGSTKQIDMVKDIMKNLGKTSCKNIVDPAMADNGKLYVGFNQDYVKAMKSLCGIADYVLPNITEACFLTDTEYKETYDEKYVDELLKKVSDLGAKKVIFTGVSYKTDRTGVIVYENGNKQYYEHRKISKGCHGTGDIYASAFVGALLNNKTDFEAAKIAADYTVKCIENTIDDPNHWYGAKFETAIPELIKAINNH